MNARTRAEGKTDNIEKQISEICSKTLKNVIGLLLVVRLLKRCFFFFFFFDNSGIRTSHLVRLSHHVQPELAKKVLEAKRKPC